MYLPGLSATLEGIWKLLSRKSSFRLQILARELRTPLCLPCDLAGNATKELKSILKSPMKAEGGIEKVSPCDTLGLSGKHCPSRFWLAGHSSRCTLCLLVKNWD